MKTSDQINEIAKAMAQAQGEMKPAIKENTNPHFKSKFADLTSIWNSIREPLSKNGIAVWQNIESCAEGVSVSTRLVHSSGQWVENGPLTIPITKRDAQGVGSAITYAKRYSLASVVGVVCDEDDDANKACDLPTFLKEEKKTPLSHNQINIIMEYMKEDEDPLIHEKILINARCSSIEKIPSEKFDKIIEWFKFRKEKNQKEKIKTT